MDTAVAHCEAAVDGRSILVGVQFIQLVGVTAEELITRLEAWTPDAP